MSVRSGIRTEYGEIQSRKNSGREYGPEKTPDENTDQKKLRIWTLFAQCERNCIVK